MNNGSYKVNILETAALGDYELEIKGLGKYVMYRDVEQLTPKIKIKVESMISADHLDMVVTANVASDLIVNIEQGVTVCDPGACPPLHVHSLGISQFTI